jgi:hypothetical protein
MSSNRVSQADSSIETVVLIVEALHLGRGKNVSLLEKLKNGEANSPRVRYVVINLDLQTASGGEQMRAEVARQTRVLIREHQPNQVFLAVDYNEGNSGGDCTLENLAEHLLNTSDNLPVIPIIIDTNAFRGALSAEEGSKLKHQFKTKEIVLLEFIIYGGNLEKLKDACDVFAKGDSSHWLRWQSKIRATIQKKDTPQLATRRIAAIARAYSAPSILEDDTRLMESNAAFSQLAISSVGPGGAAFSTSAAIQQILEESNRRNSSRSLCDNIQPEIAATIRPPLITRSLTPLRIEVETEIDQEPSASPYFFGEMSPSDEIKETEPTCFAPHGTRLDYVTTQNISYPAYYRSKQFDSPFICTPPEKIHDEIVNSPTIRFYGGSK